MLLPCRLPFSPPSVHTSNYAPHIRGVRFSTSFFPVHEGDFHYPIPPPFPSPSHGFFSFSTTPLYALVSREILSVFFFIPFLLYHITVSAFLSLSSLLLPFITTMNGPSLHFLPITKYSIQQSDGSFDLLFFLTSAPSLLLFSFFRKKDPKLGLFSGCEPF